VEPRRDRGAALLRGNARLQLREYEEVELLRYVLLERALRYVVVAEGVLLVDVLDLHRDLAGLDKGEHHGVAELPVMVVGLLLRYRETVVVQRFPRPGDVGEVEQLRRRVRFHRREEGPVAVDRGVAATQPGVRLDLGQPAEAPGEVGAETTDT